MYKLEQPTGEYRMAPVIGIFVFFLLIAATYGINDLVQRKNVETAQREALKFAHLVEESMSSELTVRLSMVNGLSAFWYSNQDSLTGSFRNYAQSILQFYELGVRSLQLAPNGIVEYVYPMVGNESAVGFDILKATGQSVAAMRAISNRNTVVAGPFTLIQGGKGLVARRPLFTRDEDAGGAIKDFWGFATVVLDFEPMVRGINGHIAGSIYDVAIRGKDALGPDGEVFFGEADVFNRSPILVDIDLPNGTWQVGVVPHDGWPDEAAASTVLWFSGAFIAFVVGLLVFKLLSSMNQLQAARKSAEEAIVTKSRLLAAVSHDLRQPLQAMNMFIYALKTNEKDKTKLATFSKAEMASKAMGLQINSLLDMSRLEAGSVQVDTKRFRADDVIASVLDEMMPMAVEKGLELEFVPCSQLVLSDPILVESILRNLVSNAIKYTAEGRVLVGCRRRPGKQLEFQVWDTGQGIPESYQSEIFSAFFQVKQSATEQGLGLGLSIVQKAAELLNCKLDVNSRPGYGSVFSVAVPQL